MPYTKGIRRQREQIHQADVGIATSSLGMEPSPSAAKPARKGGLWVGVAGAAQPTLGGLHLARLRPATAIPTHKAGD